MAGDYNLIEKQTASKPIKFSLKQFIHPKIKYIWEFRGNYGDTVSEYQKFLLDNYEKEILFVNFFTVSKNVCVVVTYQ